MTIKKKLFQALALLLFGAALGLLAFLQSVSAAPAAPQEDEEGFTKLGPPKRGEWRDVFKEPAQSFEKYTGGTVNRKSEKRKTFYIQPLGTDGKNYKEIRSGWASTPSRSSARPRRSSSRSRCSRTRWTRSGGSTTRR